LVNPRHKSDATFLFTKVKLICPLILASKGKNFKEMLLLIYFSLFVKILSKGKKGEYKMRKKFLILTLTMALIFCGKLSAMVSFVGSGVRFSPDGKWLAYSGRKVSLRNLETGETIELPGVPWCNLYHGIDFSPDGKILASTAENMDDCAVCFWDMQTRKSLVPLLPGGELFIAFSPDGRFTVSDDDEGITVYDLRKVALEFGAVNQMRRINVPGRMGKIKLPPGETYGPDFNPDSKILAVGVDGIRLYDTETWQKLKTLPNGEVKSYAISGLDFSPDGKLLASVTPPEEGQFSSFGHTVVLWDWKRGEVVKKLNCEMGAVSSVRFSPSGRYIACGAEIPLPECEVVIFEVSTGEEISRFPCEELAPVTDIDFSPDEKFLAWIHNAAADTDVRIMDISDIAAPVEVVKSAARLSHSVIVAQNWNQVRLLGAYGAVNIPIEKSFENKKNPLGANLEFSRSNWDFSFGFGYNQMEANKNEWLLKTETLYLYGKYAPFTLKNLSPFVSAGVTSWKSTFQFTKYPEMENYYPEEEDNDIGYLLGIGVSYNYKNLLLIGLQYQLLGSGEGSFGKVPEEDEFTNHYLLYTGANQLQLLLGYQLEF